MNTNGILTRMSYNNCWRIWSSPSMNENWHFTRNWFGKRCCSTLLVCFPSISASLLLYVRQGHRYDQQHPSGADQCGRHAHKTSFSSARRRSIRRMRFLFWLLFIKQCLTGDPYNFVRCNWLRCSDQQQAWLWSGHVVDYNNYYSIIIELSARFEHVKRKRPRTGQQVNAVLDRRSKAL